MRTVHFAAIIGILIISFLAFEYYSQQKTLMVIEQASQPLEYNPELTSEQQAELARLPDEQHAEYLKLVYQNQQLQKIRAQFKEKLESLKQDEDALRALEKTIQEKSAQTTAKGAVQ